MQKEKRAYSHQHTWIILTSCLIVHPTRTKASKILIPGCFAALAKTYNQKGWKNLNKWELKTVKKTEIVNWGLPLLDFHSDFQQEETTWCKEPEQ